MHTKFLSIWKWSVDKISYQNVWVKHWTSLLLFLSNCCNSEVDSPSWKYIVWLERSVLFSIPNLDVADSRCWKLKYRGLETLGQFLFARGLNTLWEDYSGEISKVEECLFWQNEKPTVVFWFQEGREHYNLINAQLVRMECVRTHVVRACEGGCSGH